MISLEAVDLDMIREHLLTLMHSLVTATINFSTSILMTFLRMTFSRMTLEVISFPSILITMPITRVSNEACVSGEVWY